MSAYQDSQADKAIAAMVVAVVGTAAVPAHVNWAITASAMGVGVVAIGKCYNVQLTKDEAWKLIKEFFKAAGFWFAGMAIASKLLSAVIESTGIGYAGGVVLDGAVSAALAYAIGECSKSYFKGERNMRELGEKLKATFRAKKNSTR